MGESSILAVVSIIVVIILGIIQGVTEFLPVSSSGHVLIASKLFGQVGSFEFDVLVSFGTLLAVIIYYRRRIWQIITDIFKKRDLNLALKLIVASIPAVIVGFLFQDIIEKFLHGTPTVIAMLLVIGILMIISTQWAVKKTLPVNQDLHKISYKQALLIGLAQCTALISGSSRSGVTMLAALKMGFSKARAAEWSFLMSIPIIFGASMKVLVSDKGIEFVKHNTVAFVLANVVSFIAGMLAIHVLLKLLQQKGLYWFGWYRVVLAIVLIILVSVKML